MLNKDKRVYELDCDVTERVFAELDGRHGNATKIMVVLLGKDDSKDGNLTLTELAGRTGMSKKAVMSSLEVLRKREMLEYAGNVVKLKIDELTGDERVETESKERHVYASDWDKLNNKTDKSIRKMLGEIGVNYVALTKVRLEEAAGEPLDPEVLEAIIKAHPEAWVEEERKSQNYFFAVLYSLVGSEYQRMKKKLRRKEA